MRGCADRVADEKDLVWGEFQTRQDPISFYRYDPVRLTKFEDNSGGKPHEFAANLASATESRIAPRKELRLGGHLLVPPTVRFGVQRRLWMLFIAGAFGLALVEWWTYNRRVTV